MVHIPESLLQLLSKCGEGQIGLEGRKAVTPRALLSQSVALQQGDSKLAALYIISKTSGVHILPISEEEIGQFGGGTVEILGSFHIDCLLLEHACWVDRDLGGCS